MFKKLQKLMLWKYNLDNVLFTVIYFEDEARKFFFFFHLCTMELVNYQFYSQITESAILKQNLHVKTDIASRSCGCVILIMIVEMTQMNPHTCAGKVSSK